MNLKLKALTAALVLAASASAHAAVDLANTGNGSLMLTLLDRTANVSAVFDLGYSYLDFNASAAVGAIGAQLDIQTPITWNLVSNPDYSAVLTAFTTAGGSLANAFYGVTAADNLGTTTLGGQGYLGSYVSQGAAVLSSPVVTAVGNFKTYVDNAANAPSLTLFSNLNTAVNGGAVANVATGGPAYANNIYNLNRVNGTGNNVMATVGTTMGFQQVVTGANGLAASNQTTFNNPLLGHTFTLTNAGTLTYVGAVPEADTWAMMMLGLGFMGFVARRKQQA